MDTPQPLKPDHDLHRQLMELAHRLDRIEAHLGIHPVTAAVLPIAIAPAPEPADVDSSAAIAQIVPDFNQDAAQVFNAPAPSNLTEPLGRDALQPTVQPADTGTPSKPVRSLEGLVGGRYFLAAGAIVVVIGMGLFLKLGYDAGWFRMSPPWKCIWGAVVGLTLIAAGEVARRIINVFASSGLSAAGLGTLYLTTYAAHGFYSLIGPTPAFLLLAVVTALGIAIAVIARQSIVAILALLGGYLAPFLLDADHPSIYVIPLHALALLTTGLTLSAWRPEIFRLLRTIAWLGTFVLGTLWTIFIGRDHPLVALPFLAFFWAAVHAELIISVRGQLDPETIVPSSTPTPFLLRWQASRALFTSISTSVWCVLVGVLVLQRTPVLPDWFVPAGAMAAAVVLSMTLAGHLRVLRDSPRTDAQRLGAGLAIQAGALLVAAVSLAFTGSAEVLAWLAIGVAAFVTAAWVGAPSLIAYGFVILSIGAARLVLFDSIITRNAFTAVNIASLAVDRWTLLMMAASGAWIAAAFMTRRMHDSFLPNPEETHRVRVWFVTAASNLCPFIGVGLLVGSFVHPDTSSGALAVAWGSVGLLVSIASAWAPRYRFTDIGIFVLVLAAGAWAHAYVLPGWSRTAAGLLHPGAAVGGFLTLVGATLALWRIRDKRNDVETFHRVATIAFAVSIALALSSFEIFRLTTRAQIATVTPYASLTTWWGVITIGLFIIGFRLKQPPVLLFGAATMFCTLAAWVVAFVLPKWSANTAGAPIHPGFITAILFATALALIARRWRSSLHAGKDHISLRDTQIELLTIIVVAISLTWCVTSLEIYRLAAFLRANGEAQHGALSVWWGVFAALLLAAGFRWKVASARYAGLALLSIATLKALIIDLADVSAGWRVASVLALGMLMLGVALVYVKASARLAAPAPVPPTNLN